MTSACFSPRLEKNIGYAMVPIEHAELGTELEVERPDGTVSATVVEMPFIDPKKETPKQELAGSSGLSTTAVHILSPPLDDERRGELIFEGSLVVFKRVPPLLEAARLIDGWIGGTLGSIAEVDLDAIDGLRNRFRGEPGVTALFRAGLEHVGVDASRSYWDSLYLRVVPPVDPGAGRQIGRIETRREDTWSSNVPQQTNWWTTIYSLASERTLAFYPEYWSRPIANTSAEWDLNEIRSAAASGSRMRICRSCPSRASL